ncbi:MAG: hypothetical protein ACK5TL_00160 [bacterium]
MYQAAVLDGSVLDALAFQQVGAYRYVCERGHFELSYHEPITEQENELSFDLLPLARRFFHVSNFLMGQKLSGCPLSNHLRPVHALAK